MGQVGDGSVVGVGVIVEESADSVTVIGALMASLDDCVAVTDALMACIMVTGVLLSGE